MGRGTSAIRDMMAEVSTRLAQLVASTAAGNTVAAVTAKKGDWLRKARRERRAFLR
ncbi:hypothetical protein GRAN_3505 [Granulicella sibirica]|uniref:Uncharacterized protein n=1 Tax=Granulicella sibirica TaxID=2479048 RepID=A0A4Q0T3Q0_9BACT|nr:hypothetical protein GRAN_3505 [Granulicella sibirica]